MNLNNMTISSKSTAACGFLMVLVVATGLIGMYVHQRTKTESIELTDDSLARNGGIAED